MPEGAGPTERVQFDALVENDGHIRVPLEILQQTGLCAGKYGRFEVVAHKPIPSAQAIELEARLRAVETDELGRNTFFQFLPLWMNNFAINLPKLRGAKSVSAIKSIGGKAVVCAAGPSLREVDLGVLRQFSGQIIAVNKALVPLLKSGVVPHWVVALDGQPEVMNSFRDPIIQEFRGASKFLGVSVLSPEVVDFAMDWAEECYWANPDIPSGQASDWDLNMVMELMNGLELARHGGNAGTFAYLLAKRLGCTPIAMLGFDLCFRPDRSWTKKKAMGYEYIYNPETDELMALDAPFRAYLGILTNTVTMAWEEGVVTVNVSPRGVLKSSSLYPDFTLEEFVAAPSDYIIGRAKEEYEKAVAAFIDNLKELQSSKPVITREEY